MEDAQKVFSNDLASFLRIYRDDASRRQWCIDLYSKVCVRYCNTLRVQLPPLEDIELHSLLDLLYTGNWLPNLILAHAFQSKERSILAGRRLAVLEGGNVALVPPMAQAGDVMYNIDRYPPLWIWDGTFVFRPLSRDCAHSTTSEMSSLQLESIAGFRDALQ